MPETRPQPRDGESTSIRRDGRPATRGRRCLRSDHAVLVCWAAIGHQAVIPSGTIPGPSMPQLAPANPAPRADRSPGPGAERTRAAASRSPSCGPVRDGGTGGRAARRRPHAERTRARTGRTRAPVPSEPGRPPSVRRGAASCGTGPGAGPRTARDRIAKGHPSSSGVEAASFSESAAGCGAAPRPGRPGRGPGLKRTHDPTEGDRHEFGDHAVPTIESRPWGGEKGAGCPGPSLGRSRVVRGGRRR